MNSHRYCSRSHLCQADNKQPLDLVSPQYTTHDKKKVETKYEHHGTQTTSLGVMIGRCSPNSQHWRPDRHPAKVGCSLFRCTNDDLKNQTNQRRKHKTWTREDSQLVLYCYFRSNPTQRGYRKRMIEIWQECASFLITSQRLAGQFRTVIKKGWFSDLEILKKYTRK